MFLFSLNTGLALKVSFYCTFISVLITVSMIDIDYRIIPDIISIPGIFVFAGAFIVFPEMTFFESLSGVLFGGGLLYAIAVFYYLIKNKEGMGGGDVKLLAMIGAALGVKGVLFTIFCGSLLGSVVGGIMIYFQKKGTDLQIPFGPFLSIGALIYIFYGNQVIHWYFDLFL
jgi:leader peptidase (prepilin peptidase) / N-methyltransferase